MLYGNFKGMLILSYVFVGPAKLLGICSRLDHIWDQASHSIPNFSLLQPHSLHYSDGSFDFEMRQSNLQCSIQHMTRFKYANGFVNLFLFEQMLS